MIKFRDANERPPEDKETAEVCSTLLQVISVSQIYCWVKEVRLRVTELPVRVFTHYVH